MDSDGSNEFNVNGTGQYARWSPDGDKLVFHDGPPATREIYTINTDGTDLVNISNNPGSADQVAFAGSPGTEKPDLPPGAPTSIPLVFFDTRATALGVSALSVMSQNAADFALKTIDSAIKTCARNRAIIGSEINIASRYVAALEEAELLAIQANSSVMDLNIVDEVSKMADALIRNEAMAVTMDYAFDLHHRLSSKLIEDVLGDPGSVFATPLYQIGDELKD